MMSRLFHEHKPKRWLSSQSKVLIPLVFLIVILIVVYPGWLRISLFGLQSYLNGVETSVEGEFSAVELVRERDRLLIQLEERQYDLKLYDAMRAEYAELERLLALQTTEVKTAARVILRPPQTRYDTLVLDKGQTDGVELGDLVATERVLVGRVSQVFLEQSVVVLLSAPEEELRVSILTQATPTVATLVGRGAGNFEIRLPRQHTISTSSIAYLSALPQYLIAQVDRVEAEPTDSLQRLLLQFPINLQNIDQVNILTFHHDVSSN